MIIEPDFEIIQDNLIVLSQILHAGLLKESEILDACQRAKIKILIMESESRNGVPLVLQHPALYALYYRLKALNMNCSALEVECISDFLDFLPHFIYESYKRADSNLETLGIALDFDFDELVYRLSVDRSKAMAKQCTSQDNGVNFISSAVSFYHKRELIEKALSYISKTWPAFYKEFELYVKSIVFFEHPEVVGFADFNCHGIIFINMSHMQDYYDLADSIVHEASHVRLNAQMTTTPFFVNDHSKLYKTPLRKDLRPLYGAFHQMVVLARLAYFWSKAKGSPMKYQKRQKSYTRDLQSIYNVLVEDSTFTYTGQKLLAELLKLGLV